MKQWLSKQIEKDESIQAILLQYQRLRDSVWKRTAPQDRPIWRGFRTRFFQPGLRITLLGFLFGAIPCAFAGFLDPVSFSFEDWAWASLTVCSLIAVIAIPITTFLETRRTPYVSEYLWEIARIREYLLYTLLTLFVVFLAYLSLIRWTDVFPPWCSYGICGGAAGLTVAVILTTAFVFTEFGRVSRPSEAATTAANYAAWDLTIAALKGAYLERFMQIHEQKLEAHCENLVKIHSPDQYFQREIQAQGNQKRPWNIQKEFHLQTQYMDIDLAGLSNLDSALQAEQSDLNFCLARIHSGLLFGDPKPGEIHLGTLFGETSETESTNLKIRLLRPKWFRPRNDKVHRSQLRITQFGEALRTSLDQNSFHIFLGTIPAICRDLLPVSKHLGAPNSFATGELSRMKWQLFGAYCTSIAQILAKSEWTEIEEGIQAAPSLRTVLDTLYELSIDFIKTDQLTDFQILSSLFCDIYVKLEACTPKELRDLRGQIARVYVYSRTLDDLPSGCSPGRIAEWARLFQRGIASLLRSVPPNKDPEVAESLAEALFEQTTRGKNRLSNSGRTDLLDSIEFSYWLNVGDILAQHLDENKRFATGVVTKLWPRRVHVNELLHLYSVFFDYKSRPILNQLVELSRVSSVKPEDIQFHPITGVGSSVSMRPDPLTRINLVFALATIIYYRNANLPPSSVPYPVIPLQHALDRLRDKKDLLQLENVRITDERIDELKTWLQNCEQLGQQQTQAPPSSP